MRNESSKAERSFGTPISSLTLSILHASVFSMGYALRQKEMIVETSEPEVWILMHDGQNQWKQVSWSILYRKWKLRG